MSDLLKKIREAERQSHLEVYSTKALYEEGSWLAKPVKTVLDILPLFAEYSAFRALDLGCGVGRNAIAVARHFSGVSCRVDCVDILEYAIERLMVNAVQFGVDESIHGVISSIDEYMIDPNSYDLILAVSALEHVDSTQTFLEKLHQIRTGLRTGGIACIIVNSGVTEQDNQTGEPLSAQFEVNLSTDSMKDTLIQVFKGFSVIKFTTVHQTYTIPRGSGLADIETDVVTLVVQKSCPCSI